MRLGMRAVAGCLAILVTTTVALVPGAVGWAGTCQRTLRIDPQETGGEGLGALTVVVRSSGCAAAGNVAFGVVSGTAQAGVDFHPVSGTLSWVAGDAGHRSISVPIVPDAEVEADLESFTLRLTTPSPGVSLGRASGEGRILDDEGLQPAWALDIVDCPLPEWLQCLCQPIQKPVGVEDRGDGRLQGDEDCVEVEFPLSIVPLVPVSFVWSTVDGTARGGVDFVAVVDRVQTVPAGVARARLRIALLPQPPHTPPRWFGVEVSAVSTGTLADPVAVVTLP